VVPKGHVAGYLFAAAVSTGMIAAACAEVVPNAMPGDSRLVVFRYDANNTYTILAMPGMPTDIQISADEKMSGFAIGDTVQWVIEELPGHIFIKPLKASLFTAGTLVRTLPPRAR
jgi:type IV secretion system protein TrbG